MPNDINALRESLFAVLAGLKSGDIKIEQAKAINETAQTLINTAKVEVDFMRVSGKTITSEFLPALPEPKAPPDDRAKELTSTGIKTISVLPGGSLTSHRLRG